MHSRASTIVSHLLDSVKTAPRSAVTGGNVSGKKCETDFRSRGRELDTGLVPYFRGIDHKIISTVILLLQEGLLSVTSESMCTKYWLNAYSSLPRKNVVR